MSARAVITQERSSIVRLFGVDFSRLPLPKLLPFLRKSHEISSARPLMARFYGPDLMPAVADELERKCVHEAAMLMQRADAAEPGQNDLPEIALGMRTLLDQRDIYFRSEEAKKTYVELGVRYGVVEAKLLDAQKGQVEAEMDRILGVLSAYAWKLTPNARGEYLDDDVPLRDRWSHRAGLSWRSTWMPGPVEDEAAARAVGESASEVRGVKRRLVRLHDWNDGVQEELARRIAGLSPVARGKLLLRLEALRESDAVGFVRDLRDYVFHADSDPGMLEEEAFTAFVDDLLKEHSDIPRPEWRGLAGKIRKPGPRDPAEAKRVREAELAVERAVGAFVERSLPEYAGTRLEKRSRDSAKADLLGQLTKLDRDLAGEILYSLASQPQLWPSAWLDYLVSLFFGNHSMRAAAAQMEEYLLEAGSEFEPPDPPTRPGIARVEDLPPHAAQALLTALLDVPQYVRYFDAALIDGAGETALLPLALKVASLGLGVLHPGPALSIAGALEPAWDRPVTRLEEALRILGNSQRRDDAIDRILRRIETTIPHVGVVMEAEFNLLKRARALAAWSDPPGSFGELFDFDWAARTDVETALRRLAEAHRRARSHSPGGLAELARTTRLGPLLHGIAERAGVKDGVVDAVLGGLLSEGNDIDERLEVLEFVVDFRIRSHQVYLAARRIIDEKSPGGKGGKHREFDAEEERKRERLRFLAGRLTAQ